MDTLTNIPASMINDFDSLHVADLTEEERSLIINYVGLTRDVTEAQQLFDAFYFNMLNMRNLFVFNANDTVTRTEYCLNCDSDFIAVNSLVVNLISSARTLTEFLRARAAKWLENSEFQEDKSKDEFNIYASQIYNTSFVYRLLINLRNYMQHGYLPVSFKEGRYSFDINQILSPPHFKINGKLKSDMKNFIDACENPGENIACISLTLTIADFSVKVIDIYNKFLFYIKSCVFSSYNDVKQLIQTKPSIVCDYHEGLNGFIIYDLDERAYQVLNPNENPNDIINIYEKRVSAIYNDEKIAFDELLGSFSFFEEVML